LKRRTASKRNSLSRKIAHEFKDDLNDGSVRKGLPEYRKEHSNSTPDYDDMKKIIAPITIEERQRLVIALLYQKPMIVLG
jgi:hypothetical protein